MILATTFLKSTLGRFTHPGFMAHWAEEVLVDALPWEFSKLAKGSVLDISISSDCCLLKELNVPSGAAKNLDKAVDLFIRTSFPGQVDDITWTYVKQKTDTKNVLAKIYILKRNSLSTLIRAAENTGYRIRTVKLDLQNKARPIVDYSEMIDRPLRFWQMVHYFLAAAIIGTLIWFAFENTHELRGHVSRLQSEKNTLSEQAVAQKSAAEARSTNLLSYQQDVARLNFESGRLEVLLNLSETLSDKTWVSELSITDDIVSVSGFTADSVSSVVERVRSLDEFTSIELQGNVSFDTISRRHRFELNATLAKLGSSQR